MVIKIIQGRFPSLQDRELYLNNRKQFREFELLRYRLNTDWDPEVSTFGLRVANRSPPQILLFDAQQKLAALTLLQIPELEKMSKQIVETNASDCSQTAFNKADLFNQDLTIPDRSPAQNICEFREFQDFYQYFVQLKSNESSADANVLKKAIEYQAQFDFDKDLLNEIQSEISNQTEYHARCFFKLATSFMILVSRAKRPPEDLLRIAKNLAETTTIEMEFSVLDLQQCLSWLVNLLEKLEPEKDVRPVWNFLEEFLQKRFTKACWKNQRIIKSRRVDIVDLLIVDNETMAKVCSSLILEDCQSDNNQLNDILFFSLISLSNSPRLYEQNMSLMVSQLGQ
ncbi:hypothetical protein Ciccas_009425 [Cichlidogyrus casuarinus]|uniref:Uncharacterized protein n=1 Tax=Cichlidogyrus casuarinus TaxID=1844966 RepID=A0ABD2PXB1_9PLAT